MAEFIDLPDEESELSQFGDKPQDSTKIQDSPEELDDTPEKYKGKSAKDIIKMHQEAERMAGRQAQEVGELRKITDEFLKQQILGKNTAEQPQAKEIDFFDDPKESVRRLVESHPDVVAAKTSSQNLQKMQTKALLADRHPDFQEIVTNPEFAEWVKKSKIRSQLYAQADASFDYDAADELMSTWKQIKGTTNVKANEEAEKLREKGANALKSANTDMGSGSGESSKKVYRRADLRRLYTTDRTRYDAMQDEIAAAYREGRVK